MAISNLIGLVCEFWIAKKTYSLDDSEAVNAEFSASDPFVWGRETDSNRKKITASFGVMKTRG